MHPSIINTFGKTGDSTTNISELIMLVGEKRPETENKNKTKHEKALKNYCTLRTLATITYNYL